MHWHQATSHLRSWVLNLRESRARRLFSNHLNRFVPFVLAPTDRTHSSDSKESVLMGAGSPVPKCSAAFPNGEVSDAQWNPPVTRSGLMPKKLHIFITSGDFILRPRRYAALKSHRNPSICLFNIGQITYKSSNGRRSAGSVRDGSRCH